MKTWDPLKMIAIKKSIIIFSHEYDKKAMGQAFFAHHA